MKRIGLILITVGFLLAAGCESGGTIQKLEGTPTPTPSPTPEATPTPGQGRVIGRGALDISSGWYNSQPTANQEVRELGTIPFEILNTLEGAEKVEGRGVVTFNQTIEFTTGDTCVYQAVSTEAVVSGAFVGQPTCDFSFKLTIDYPAPHLISGGALCGAEQEWAPFVFEVPQMDAVNGTKYHYANDATGTETGITLNNLVLGDETGCFAGDVTFVPPE